MKRIVVLLMLACSTYIFGQVLPGTPVSGFPSGTTAQIKTLTPPEGIVAYSTDEKIFYYYNGTTWLSLSTVPNSAKIFYPPSVAIDASTTGTGRTLNLYDEYKTQFEMPAAKSDSAPALIPIYAANELYFYVTAYDTTILTITNIDDNGLMTYNVDKVPTDDNTIINVVFVVR